MAFANVKTAKGQVSLIPDEEPAEENQSPNKTAEDWIDDVVFALEAPLIVWRGYEKETPEDWKHKAQMARLLNLIARQPDERGMATDLEVCYYVSQFTLEHVPSHEVSEVYMHAFRKAYGDEKADRAGLPRQKLEHESRDLYMRTKRWIYRQQLEHLKLEGVLGDNRKKDQPREKVNESQSKLI